MNDWRHVLHRGKVPINGVGDYKYTVQYPGIWLSPQLTNIVFEINTGKNALERIQIMINDFNKWTNYTIILDHYVFSVYENGNYSFDVLLEEDNTVFNLYSIRNIPTTYNNI